MQQADVISSRPAPGGSLDSRLSVHARFLPMLGWCFIAGFAVMAVIAFVNEAYDPAFFLFPLVIPGLWLLSKGGTLSIDSRRIELSNVYGRFAIPWSDLRSVRTDAMGGTYLFRGAGKWISAPGPRFWSGRHVAEFRDALGAELARRDIEIQEVTESLETFAPAKNCRVPRGSM